jgi:hypothetical protein
VFAGCQAPPGVCEVHHLVTWAHGGTTSLDNLALLCRRHHRAVHEDGFVLLGSPRSGLRTIRPDGTPVPGSSVRRLSELRGPSGPTWGDDPPDALPLMVAEGSSGVGPATGPDPP